MRRDKERPLPRTYFALLRNDKGPIYEPSYLFLEAPDLTSSEDIVASRRDCFRARCGLTSAKMAECHVWKKEFRRAQQPKAVKGRMKAQACHHVTYQEKTR